MFESWVAPVEKDAMKPTTQKMRVKIRMKNEGERSGGGSRRREKRIVFIIILSYRSPLFFFFCEQTRLYNEVAHKSYPSITNCLCVD